MKELLFSIKAEDCEWSYFKGSGKGGQKKQKTSSGVAVLHRPSGATGECSENRQQHLNKRIAWNRMANSIAMRRWINKRIAEIDMGKTIEQWADEQIKPDKIKTEIKIDGKWIETKEL